MSFQPIDESKEDFRMYLAKHGVLDSLTKVLAKIQEHQPENPLEVRLENFHELSRIENYKIAVSQRQSVNFSGLPGQNS